MLKARRPPQWKWTFFTQGVFDLPASTLVMKYLVCVRWKLGASVTLNSYPVSRGVHVLWTNPEMIENTFLISGMLKNMKNSGFQKIFPLALQTSPKQGVFFVRLWKCWTSGVLWLSADGFHAADPVLSPLPEAFHSAAIQVDTRKVWACQHAFDHGGNEEVQAQLLKLGRRRKFVSEQPSCFLACVRRCERSAQVYYRYPLHRCSQGETMGTCPPKFLAHLVVLCVERQCPKQNTVARLKWSIWPPKKFWAGYAIDPLGE